MSDKQPSKADALRAMREANYAAKSSRGRRDEAHPAVQPASAPRRSERPNVAATDQRPGGGVAPAPREANPVAKEPEASRHNRPVMKPKGPGHRGSSRLGAGRTAQDGGRLKNKIQEPAVVAIPKRGRPRKPFGELSRASRYRRKAEAEKAKP